MLSLQEGKLNAQIAQLANQLREARAKIHELEDISAPPSPKRKLDDEGNEDSELPDRKKRRNVCSCSFFY
jgi:hypothetical protein